VDPAAHPSARQSKPRLIDAATINLENRLHDDVGTRHHLTRRDTICLILIVAARSSRLPCDSARTVEINLLPSGRGAAFDERRIGPATRVVPAWVGEVWPSWIAPVTCESARGSDAIGVASA